MSLELVLMISITTSFVHRALGPISVSECSSYSAPTSRLAPHMMLFSRTKEYGSTGQTSVFQWQWDLLKLLTLSRRSCQLKPEPITRNGKGQGNECAVDLNRVFNDEGAVQAKIIASLNGLVLIVNQSSNDDELSNAFLLVRLAIFLHDCGIGGRSSDRFAIHRDHADCADQDAG